MRMWMRIGAICLAICGVASRKSTQPSMASKIPLEIRATAAFNEGQYALALPLLKEVAAAQSDPQKLGSLQEQIRVCEKNMADGITAAPVAAPPAIATAPETRKPHVRPGMGRCWT